MPIAIMVAYLTTKREELESALGEAEAAREQLETALAKAEAALVSTVTDASKIDANRAEAAAKVAAARARCRQLYAAIAEPGQSEFTTRSRKRMGTPGKQSGEVAKPSATATPPSTQINEHAARGENKKEQQKSTIDRPQIRFSARERSLRYAIARSSLVRQAIGFLALISAYLAYFDVDVQLQIVRLPSIVTYLLQ